MPLKTTKGTFGEEYAASVLKGKGYRIVERNFHSKFGEIDIIAVHRGILKFIEVKSRWTHKYGKPEESITSRKIKNIRKTIDYYLLYNKSKRIYKIEIIAIDFTNKLFPEFKIIEYS